MARLNWTEGAAEDFEQLLAYIARDDPRAARKFGRRIWARVKALKKLPRTGKKVAEHGGVEVRRVWVGEYYVAYEVSGQVKTTIVNILGVKHGRRNVE